MTRAFSYFYAVPNRDATDQGRRKSEKRYLEAEEDDDDENDPASRETPGHLASLIVYVVIFSLGEALWSSRFLEYIADVAPAGKVGAYMGIAGIPWFLAKATTGFYSGLMLERFVPAGGPAESGTMWLIYACIALISPLGLMLARRWLEKGVPEKR